MKQRIYIFLFSLLGIMISLLIFYGTIFGIIFTKFNHPENIRIFHKVLCSPFLLAGIILLGAFLGFKSGKRWWQIIYVDKVYYFDKSLDPRNIKK